LKEDYQGLTWIYLTPPESEANVILSLAKEKGFATLEEVMLHTNWPLEKASIELKKFVQAGNAIEDTSYSSGTKYYFPGLN
jgi:hypothetical protein